jgi:hypothetical protein
MAADLTIPNNFVAGTPAVADQVDQNFDAVRVWINANAVHLDASKAFTNVPSGPNTDPTSANHLTRKAYVDAQVAARPAGRLGSATTTTVQTSTGAESADIFTPFNVVLGSTRWVKVTLFLDSISSTAGSDVTNLRIYVGGVIRTNSSYRIAVAGQTESAHLTWEGQLPAGTYAVTARHVRASGTGTVSVGGQGSPREARIIVEDLGA